MEQILVTCVYKSGGHYTPDYVYRLRDNLKAVTPNARFVCLSDQALEVDTIPLIHNWSGWWSKIELFRPKLFSEPVLFVDLDTVFRKDITPLMDYPHKFTAIRNFMHPANGMASAVMAFNGDYSHIYRQFIADRPKRVMAEYRTSAKWGDQDYIKQHVTPEYWQDIRRGEVTSVKLHRRTAKERIVCFHGKPKPIDVDWDVMRVATKGMRV